MAQQRQAWRQEMATWDPTRLVFLDETGAATNLTRRYGRADRSARCLAKAPHGHWHTNTFVAALRCDGVTAPALLNAPMDGQIFRAWVEQFLVPTLRPGDLVIADNLSSHKVAGIREAIEATGAKLRYLPPYSPDLNPIEMFFSKLKAHLRQAAQRTFDGLREAIACVLESVSPSECKNYFHAAGYCKL